MIGLFGDPLQTIYSNDVVGNQLEDLIPTINLTSAKINYRSVPEIVNLANKIRNDKNQEQIPLKSSNNRAVHAYTISSGPLAKSRIDEFINQYLKEISKNDTVDVLSLKNEDVATWCGFDSFFKEFKGTPFYKEHFKSYADDIMSNDLKKLHLFSFHCII
jgi:superfamily I DNA/RNA helicase